MAIPALQGLLWGCSRPRYRGQHLWSLGTKQDYHDRRIPEKLYLPLLPGKAGDPPKRYRFLRVSSSSSQENQCVAVTTTITGTLQKAPPALRDWRRAWPVSDAGTRIRILFVAPSQPECRATYLQPLAPAGPGIICSRHSSTAVPIVRALKLGAGLPTIRMGARHRLRWWLQCRNHKTTVVKNRCPRRWIGRTGHVTM